MSYNLNKKINTTKLKITFTVMFLCLIVLFKTISASGQGTNISVIVGTLLPF